MMSHPNGTRNSWKRSLFVAAIGLLLAGVGVVAESAADQPETYTWSAELVNFDKPAKMITVKAAVVGYEMEDWSAFQEGDHVLLTWSGLNSGTGVRYISHGETELENARLTMPVEFVSVDKDGRYVLFRVPIPSSDAGSIETLEAGDWVTATAPRQNSLEGTAVASIRPYTMVG